VGVEMAGWLLITAVSFLTETGMLPLPVVSGMFFLAKKHKRRSLMKEKEYLE